MKRLFVVVVLIILCLCTAHAAEISLRSDAWCPYSCDPASDKPGILVEVARRIFQRAGHTVDYQDLNWARAIEEVREGRHDGLVDTYKSDAPDFVFPEEPIMISRMCFFVKEDDPWEYKDYNSLQDRHVSVVNSYSYGESFDDYIKKNEGKGNRIIQTLCGMDLTPRRITQMATGQIDTILEDCLVFPYQVAGHKDLPAMRTLKGFRNAGCLPGVELFIAFSPGKASSRGYADLITQGVRDMRASGELDEIVKGYANHPSP